MMERIFQLNSIFGNKSRPYTDRSVCGVSTATLCGGRLQPDTAAGMYVGHVVKRTIL